MSFLLLLGLLVPTITHTEEQTQEHTTTESKPFYYAIPMGALQVCVNIEPHIKDLCQKHCDALWNILSPAEIMTLLSWCTIGYYNQTYAGMYAPHRAERQAFIDLAQNIETAAVEFADFYSGVTFDPKTNQYDKEMVSLMLQQAFDSQKYELIYNSLRTQCTPDEAIIMQHLATPTQFKERMSIAFDELPEPILFPTYYTPENIHEKIVQTTESLHTFIESLSAQQKLFLLLESNIRSTCTLEWINENHYAALNTLKINNAMLIANTDLEGTIQKEQIDESTHALNQEEMFKNAALAVPFEFLYAKAQEIAETGTQEAKILFALQVTPKVFAQVTQELK